MSGTREAPERGVGNLRTSREITALAATARHLFRIAQDAVNNAVRRAEPQTMNLTLDVRDAFEIVLRIDDDGMGIDRVPSKRGIGLMTMEYRARAMGGRLTLETGALR